MNLALTEMMLPHLYTLASGLGNSVIGTTSSGLRGSVKRVYWKYLLAMGMPSSTVRERSVSAAVSLNEHRTLDLVLPDLTFFADEVRLVEVRSVLRSGVAGMDEDEEVMFAVFGGAVFGLGEISWLVKSFAGSMLTLIIRQY
jgi:hypothetical protein